MSSTPRLLVNIPSSLRTEVSSVIRPLEIGREASVRDRGGDA
jgi:hypothetical protein